MSNALKKRLEDVQNNSLENQNEKEKQLITIESANALQVFTDLSYLESIIDTVKEKTCHIVPDIYTDKGRKEIASMAYAIARTKTYLDNIGKELVSEYKELPKKIDAGRKFARDALDKLKDEIRKPLDEWEKEQERLKLIEEINSCHEIALLMNKEFDRLKEEKIKREQEERIALENRIREQAIKEAEEKKQREIEKALQEAQEKARLEALKKEVEHKRLLEEAEREKRIAEQQMQIILDKQRQQEQSRLAEEQRKKQEEQARLANLKHRENVDKMIFIDLKKHAGLDDAQSHAVLKALRENLIQNVSIYY